jgi:hypothetical protein
MNDYELDLTSRRYMSNSRHRSTAFVESIIQRGRGQSPNPITKQFRFIIRMAAACHDRQVPYGLSWAIENGRMRVTIMAVGTIPTPKPLKKPPKPTSTWKPSIWDAEYRREAFSTRSDRQPGFVVDHPTGLSLVHPSESPEFGVGKYGTDDDIRHNWSVTHTASGIGFGLMLSFKRAVNALLLAASFPVDWALDMTHLRSNPTCRQAHIAVIAAFGTGKTKDAARGTLAERDRAA